MKGISVRLEVGPKDIEKGQVVLVRRDTGEKIIVSADELETKIPSLLQEIQQDLLKKALLHREKNTSSATTFNEFKEVLKKKPGFVKAMWCGDVACEELIKEETTATSRCIPFEQENISETCVCCNKPADKMVYWAKAY
jgi:prolyl-tRNA synthetase